MFVIDFFLSKGGSNFYASPMVKSYFVIYETSAVTALVDIFFLFEPVDDSVCFACGNTPPGKFFFDFAFASFCGGAECGGSIEGFFWGGVLFSSVEIYRVADANRCRPNKSLSVLTSQYPSEKSISDISRAKIGLISK